MAPNVGPEIAKTAKNAIFTQTVPKLLKMCKAQRLQKSPKTALSGLANKFPEGVCVKGFCEC